MAGEMTQASLKENILRVRKEKDALILVHNYQVAEVQEIGDFIGDSLELARKAVEARKKICFSWTGPKFTGPGISAG
jgi:quinolinate synthase